MEGDGGFEENGVGPRTVARLAPFVVDLDGYEGPLDVLLGLAREQKVDLKQISMVALADQYLAFIERVRAADLELAADYLVMAAWLAYMKSRLLLPDLGEEDEPSGEEMAAALAFQLQRLEAMREAGARLLARPRLGRDVHSRGAPERMSSVVTEVYEATLYDLLKAYADQRRRRGPGVLAMEDYDLFSVDAALRRLRRLLGRVPDWKNLWSFLPPLVRDGTAQSALKARSAKASTFAASLELAREGRLRLRQDEAFGPIYLRSPARELCEAAEDPGDD